MKYLIFFFVSISLYATNLNNYINNKNCDQIIDKQVFTICYNYKMKGAKYVFYTLNGKLVNKINIKKNLHFIQRKT